MAGYIATTKTIEWSTPADVYRALCLHFNGAGSCDVDLACTPENQRAPVGLYAPDDVLAAYALPPGKIRHAAIRAAQQACLDARLADILAGPGGQSYWLNPPYGSELPLWIKFAHDIARAPRVDVGLWPNRVIVLIPARTDTRWFHEYCAVEEILFLKGRLTFGGAPSAAPFPSVAIMFGGVPRLRQFGEFIPTTDGLRVQVLLPPRA